MLINSNHIIGLPIFSIDEGKQIDKVEDIIYDPAAQRVQALIINSGGLFTEGKALDIDDVKSIGEDAVVIQSADKLKKISQLDSNVSRIAKDDTYLTQSTVMTEEGKNLGKIVDLLFDPATGKVEELEVSQGGIRDMQSGRKRIKPSNIVTVGEDALIVSSYTEVAFDAQAEQGGLQGALNQAKQTAQDAVTGVKERWESPETQDKLQQAKSDVADTFQSNKEKLQQVAEDARHRLDATANNPENQRKLEELKDKAAQTAQEIKAKADQAREKSSGAVQQGQQQAESALQEHQQQQAINQENEAVGQYITRNILDQKDHVIAKRGDMVTHNMIEQAKNAGSLDNILHNLSSQPISGYAGSLGGEVEKEGDTVEIDVVDKSSDEPIDEVK